MSQVRERENETSRTSFGSHYPVSGYAPGKENFPHTAVPPHMTTTEELAKFVQDVTIDGFSADTREELKRVLDPAGIGIDALGHEPVDDVHRTVQRTNPGTDCTLWGRNETPSPVGAAMHNTTLTRYLDSWIHFSRPERHLTLATTSVQSSPQASTSTPLARNCWKVWESPTRCKANSPGTHRSEIRDGTK